MKREITDRRRTHISTVITLVIVTIIYKCTLFYHESAEIIQSKWRGRIFVELESSGFLVIGLILCALLFAIHQNFGKKIGHEIGIGAVLFALFITLNFHAAITSGNNSIHALFFAKEISFSELIANYRLFYLSEHPAIIPLVVVYLALFSYLFFSKRYLSALWLTALYVILLSIISPTNFAFSKEFFFAIPIMFIWAIFKSLSSSRQEWLWIVLWQLSMLPLLLIFYPEIASHATGLYMILQLIAITIIAWSGFAILRYLKLFNYTSLWLVLVSWSLILLQRGYLCSSGMKRATLWSFSFLGYFFYDFLWIIAIVLLVKLLSRFDWLSTKILNFLLVSTVVLYVVDLAVLNKLGVRLSWKVLSMSDSWSLSFAMIKEFLPSIFLGIGGIILLFYSINMVVRRLVGKVTKLSDRPLRPAVSMMVITTILFVVMQFSLSSDSIVPAVTSNLISTSPMLQSIKYPRLTKAEIDGSGAEYLGFDYKLPKTTESTDITTPTNVILIVLESTPAERMSLLNGYSDTFPKLAKYRSKMQVWPNFYSVFSNSNQSRTAIYGGMFQIDDYLSYFNPRLDSPTIFEILATRGYSTALFWSSFRNFTRFNDYIEHRVDLLVDCDDILLESDARAIWGVEEQKMVDRIKQQLGQYQISGEPFCISYLPIVPHRPFDNTPLKYQYFSTKSQKLLASSTTTDAEKQASKYQAKYYDQLRYVDDMICQIVDELQRLRLAENTIVVITNDHGEYIYDDSENKLVGHGFHLQPTAQRSPFIVIDPRIEEFTVMTEVGSHVDILPSVLARLNVDLPTNYRFQGRSLYEPTTKSSNIFIASHYESALVSEGVYYRFDPKSELTTAYRIEQSGIDVKYQLLTDDDIDAGFVREKMDMLQYFMRYQNSLLRYFTDYK